VENDYQALKDKVSEELRKPSPFERYGFLRNPFPKAGEPTSEPFHNQDKVRRAFEAKFFSFVQSGGESSDRLLVFGDHRVGKTNFLLHWQHQISRLLEDGILGGFIPLYLTVASDNFIDDIHKPLVMELSKAIFPSFFEMLKTRDPDIPDGDLARAIEATLKRDSFQLKMFIDDADIRRFAKWFSGQRCTLSELRELGGVFSSIDTSSLAIRYLRDFVQLARHYEILKGVIVFLDEFELILGKAMTTSQRARYLNDLRHFVDTLQKGVLLVVASSTAILEEFQREHPALKNRFGETLELQKIQTLDEAKRYAQAYLSFGRETYNRAQKTGKTNGFQEIITEEEIAAIFEEVREKYGRAQGPFFAKLYNKVEEKVGKQEEA